MSSSSSAASDELPPHLKEANENANPNTPQFDIHATPQVGQFFAANNISLIATAYKSNLVFSFGGTDDGRLGCFYSMYPHPMAVALSPRTDCQEIWIGCKDHLIRCSDAGGMYNEGTTTAGGGGNFTSTLVARQLHAIGSQDVHGIFPLDPDSPFFLSTKFSALCQLNTSKPNVTTNVLWKPSFISEIRAEDRCHVNDVCFVGGLAKYACCISESDAHDGWRDHRETGGILLDIQTGKTVATGLSMPHSPRWYRDQLWLLNSGTGELGVVNLESGKFEAKVFIPGFLRGLKFVGRYAVVGSSLDRHEHRFKGLELGRTLESKKTTPVCGVFIIDLATFAIAHKIELKGNIHEIYDILLVPGRRARVIGVNDEEGSNMFLVEENYVRPSTTAVATEQAKIQTLEDGENEK